MFLRTLQCILHDIPPCHISIYIWPYTFWFFYHSVHKILQDTLTPIHPRYWKLLRLTISSDLRKPCCDLVTACLLLGKFSVLEKTWNFVQVIHWNKTEWETSITFLKRCEIFFKTITQNLNLPLSNILFCLVDMSIIKLCLLLHKWSEN